MREEVYFDYHMDPEPPKTKSNGRLWSAVLACFVASFGSFSFGYGMGYSSAALSYLGDKNTNDLYLSEKEIKWFTSITNIGAMMGGPLGGYVIDLCGRKLALMITAAPFGVGWLMIAFGKSAGLLYAGRFFSGIAVGMASLMVPTYIAETAPSRLRGAMGAFNQLGIVLGILMSYVVGHLMYWRESAIAGMVPAACLFVFMIFMPETARWSLNHNKDEKAEKALRWLRGPDVKIQDEINEIKDSLNVQERMSLREFFKPSIMRPFFISMTLHFFQQSTGINAVVFYTATIFEKAGFHENSTMVTILIGLIQLLACTVAFVMIDRGGRRFLLIVGGLGMCISCFSMGAYFFLTTPTTYEGPDISFVAVTSVAVYIVGFAMAWGPCTWLIMSEIFPVKARGTASGIATAFNWLCSFVITLTFPMLLKGITPAGTFWFYGSLAFLAIVFVYVFVPETKGKSLEEIQQYFEGKGKKNTAPAPVRESYV